jgi:hypothetical protein
VRRGHGEKKEINVTFWVKNGGKVGYQEIKWKNRIEGGLIKGRECDTI